MSCICRYPLLWPGPAASLLRELRTLDYYDGPTTLACKCASCGTPKLLSVVAWDPSFLRIRVFGVVDISNEQFEEIVSTITGQEQLIEKSGVPLKTPYETVLGNLLLGAPTPAVVLAADSSFYYILAARRNTEKLHFAEPVECVSKIDLITWMAKLNIPQDQRL